MYKVGLSLAFGLTCFGCFTTSSALASSMYTVDLDPKSDIGSLKYLNLTAGDYAVELLSRPGDENDSFSFWSSTTCQLSSCPVGTATGWVHAFRILSNEITSVVGADDLGTLYNGQAQYAVFDDNVYPTDVQAREAFTPVHFTLSNDESVGFWVADDTRHDNRGALLLKVTGKSVESIPTPALLPGLIGMGVAALRKRKQEADAEA